MINYIARLHGIPKWEAEKYSMYDYFDTMIDEKLQQLRDEYNPDKPLTNA